MLPITRYRHLARGYLCASTMRWTPLQSSGYICLLLLPILWYLLVYCYPANSSKIYVMLIKTGFILNISLFGLPNLGLHRCSQLLSHSVYIFPPKCYYYGSYSSYLAVFPVTLYLSRKKNSSFYRPPGARFYSDTLVLYAWTLNMFLINFVGVSHTEPC